MSRCTREEYERAVMAMRGSVAAGAGRLEVTDCLRGQEPYRMAQISVECTNADLADHMPHYLGLVIDHGAYMVHGRYEPGRYYLQAHVSVPLSDVMWLSGSAQSTGANRPSCAESEGGDGEDHDTGIVTGATPR